MIYDSHDLSDLEKTARIATKALRARQDEFEAIVVRGTSGLLIGPTVALRLRKPLLVARKQNDNSHANGVLHEQLINCMRVSMRTLFFDDLRSSGKTEREVGELVREAGGEITHVFMYCDPEWLDPVVPPSAFFRQARFEREQRYRDNESMRAVTEKLQRSNDARDLDERYRYRGGEDEDMYAQMLLPRPKTVDEAKAAFEEFERKYMLPAMSEVTRAEIRALFGLET